MMSKTLKHEAKANFLLDKGIEVLWCNGYNGTSVKDIVSAADVPKGSFYFYFDSKEDFVTKALVRYFNTMFAPMESVLSNKGVSPKQRLTNFYTLRNDRMINEMKCKLGCLANNIGNEMSEHSEKIRTTILLMESKIKDSIGAVFMEAQEKNEIDPTIDPELMVSFIEDAGKGAMISMKENQNSEPLDNFLNIVTSKLLN
jgi:TetR/AcrR family transcriptional repressor of nem operon